MYLWKPYRVVQGCSSIAQRCALETLKDNAEKESLLHPTPSRKLRAEKSSASPLRKQTTRKSQRQPRRIAAPTQWRRRWAAWRRSKRTSRAGSRCGDSTARSQCRVPCRTTEKRRATLPWPPVAEAAPCVLMTRSRRGGLAVSEQARARRRALERSGVSFACPCGGLPLQTTRRLSGFV